MACTLVARALFPPPVPPPPAVTEVGAAAPSVAEGYVAVGVTVKVTVAGSRGLPSLAHAAAISVKGIHPVSEELS